MLCQLMYTSDVRDLGEGKVTALLDQARRRNRADGVSGVLLVNHRHFVQCLEGPAEVVCATFERIAADPRHTHVTPVSLRPVAQRDFPDWGMWFVGVDQAARGPLQPFLSVGGFAPRSMTPDALVELVTGARDLVMAGARDLVVTG
jgi:hypothetical protein